MGSTSPPPAAGASRATEQAAGGGTVQPVSGGGRWRALGGACISAAAFPSSGGCRQRHGRQGPYGAISSYLTKHFASIVGSRSSTAQLAFLAAVSMPEDTPVMWPTLFASGVQPFALPEWMSQVGVFGGGSEVWGRTCLHKAAEGQAAHTAEWCVCSSGLSSPGGAPPWCVLRFQAPRSRRQRRLQSAEQGPASSALPSRVLSRKPFGLQALGPGQDPGRSSRHFKRRPGNVRGLRRRTEQALSVPEPEPPLSWRWLLATTINCRSTSKNT